MARGKRTREPPPQARIVVPTGKRLLRIDQVVDKTGLGRSTINREVRRGRFPVPIRLSGEPGDAGGIVVWDNDEVDAWIAGKAAEPRKRPPVPKRRPKKKPAPRTTAAPANGHPDESG